MIVQISLQKKGAGPLDSLELFLGFLSLNVDSKIILSNGNEIKNKWLKIKDKKDNIFFIDTYGDSIVSFLFSIICLKWLSLLRQLRKIKPEFILVTHFHPWVLFALTFRKCLFKKFIYIVHENPFDPKENDNWIMLLLQKILIKKADIIITHSKQIRLELEEYIRKPMYTFLTGSYSTSYGQMNGRLASNNIRFLFLGRIEEYKGVDILFEAFKKVENEHSNVLLTIAGRGILPPEVSSYKSNKIKIINHWLSEDEIYKILNETDVFVLPYKKASQSGVLNMAWACGLPVISSDAGGLSEQVVNGENGLLFKTGDVEDLYRKMLTICNDVNLLQKLGRGAEYYGREVYTWKAVAQGIINITKEA